MIDQIAYPKVSVIIPTYNRAELILETIESVRNQTHSNWEMIIVDDGSDDNTEEVIMQLNDDRIQYVKTERSGIGGKVKNIGINKSTGMLIAFVDSDDLWEKTKLEKQVKALQEHPDAGFCLTNGYNFRIKNEPIDFFYTNKEGIKFDNVFVDFFNSHVAGFTQALLFKKECLDKTGLFNEGKRFSDPDFITTLAFHFKAVILYEPLVFRRLHSYNHSGQNWKQNFEEGIQLIVSNRSKLPGPVYKNALFRIYINYGEKCLVFKQRRKAVKKFWKAWRCKPFALAPVKKIIKSVLKFK